MTARHKITTTYIVGDYASTLLATVLLTWVRHLYEVARHGPHDFLHFLSLPPVMTELLLFPLLMMAIYWLAGFYSDVMTKSVVQEFITTFNSAFIGIFIFFFLAILNDLVPSRLYTYRMMLVLFCILWTCVFVTRVAITIWTRNRVKSGVFGRPTIIVGIGHEAVDMASRIERARKAMALNVIGYIDPSGTLAQDAVNGLPVFSLEQVKQLCSRHELEALVVMPLSEGSQATIALIGRLLPLGCSILVPSSFYQTLGAPVHIANVAGEPLIDVSTPAISASTVNIKRVMDIAMSLTALLLLWPFLIVIALIVKHDSPGPAIYSQERVGKNKRLFKIYKFRSMTVSAESDGCPRLSTPDDSRITRVGRWLRKYRIDELPQFWNVLRGDMSMVGPRPEREYFIRQILEHKPAYTIVQQVRPGLTSWGMVKFGYASSVDQMIERLQYELIYIDNMSILVDIKIILYTIKIVLTGKGI